MDEGNRSPKVIEQCSEFVRTYLGILLTSFFASYSFVNRTECSCFSKVDKKSEKKITDRTKKVSLSKIQKFGALKLVSCFTVKKGILPGFL